MNQKITWLASYPKSGNTWFRTFLTNYLVNGTKPANINQLLATPIATSRTLFDDAAGVELSNFNNDEIDMFRPNLYRTLARYATEPVYMKVHDAFMYLETGEPLFPADASMGAVYFVRNPLDVAVSYANHNSTTLDQAIIAMHDEKHHLAGDTASIFLQLRQLLLTWSMHVISWVDQTQMPVLVLRYEDMMLNPISTFTQAVEFLGLEQDAERIQKAVGFSNFDVVKAQEQQQGFRERPPAVGSFFRKGKIGTWRDEFTDAWREYLIQHNQPMMQRFGYLTADNQPVF